MLDHHEVQQGARKLDVRTIRETTADLVITHHRGLSGADGHAGHRQRPRTRVLDDEPWHLEKQAHRTVLPCRNEGAATDQKAGRDSR